ncbi:MAG TPA: hypothetical protein VGK25_03095 [Ignavibacteria bacterium]
MLISDINLRRSPGDVISGNSHFINIEFGKKDQPFEIEINPKIEIGTAPANNIPKDKRNFLCNSSNTNSIKIETSPSYLRSGNRKASINKTYKSRFLLLIPEIIFEA